MMHRTFEINYMESADFQLAEFIYQDKDVSMLVILPKRMNGLGEVEQKFSAKYLAEALSVARPTRLLVSLPKFQLTEEFNLGKDLAALGMKDAFDAGAANFTGMLSNPKREKLFVAAVVHKAFVDVDEKGTEAAGGTGVIVAKKSASLLVPFRADRPFLFLLRQNLTGSILFMGRVSDPRQE